MKTREVLIYAALILTVVLLFISEIRMSVFAKKVKEFDDLKRMYVTVDSIGMANAIELELQLYNNSDEKAIDKVNRIDSYTLFQLQQDAIHLSDK